MSRNKTLTIWNETWSYNSWVVMVEISESEWYIDEVVYVKIYHHLRSQSDKYHIYAEYKESVYRGSCESNDTSYRPDYNNRYSDCPNNFAVRCLKKVKRLISIMSHISSCCVFSTLILTVVCNDQNDARRDPFVRHCFGKPAFNHLSL